MLPREKFTKKGIDNLTDLELIQILVGSGIKGKDFVKVSKAILKKFRKIFQEGNNVNVKDLSKVEGVGEVTAMKILAGIELGKRLYGIGITEKEIITNSQQAYERLKKIGERKKEYLVGIFLNSRFEIIAEETIGIGSLDGVGIVPRDVIIPALEHNAAYVVIAHNHPSGDCTPSREDIEVTKRISEALSLVGLELIDHLVISDSDWQSIGK